MYDAMTGRGRAQAMDLYLGQIKDDALLTAAEECRLAVAIRDGDRDAHSHMVRANLRLVVVIAREYLNRGLSMDDLVGEGNLGLIRAAERFDPAFGTRFSTYAACWIKQAMRHALAVAAPTIRLPAHVIGLMTKWRRAERAESRRLGRAPEFDEVAAALELSKFQRRLVEHALRARRVRCDDPRGDDDDSHRSAEAADRAEPPDAALEADDERRAVRRRLVERLDDRERAILSLRFGLDGDEPLTLKEVGLRLGVTREWVRKIEARAVRKLESPDAPPPAPSAPRRRPAPAARKSPAFLPALSAI